MSYDTVEYMLEEGGLLSLLHWKLLVSLSLSLSLSLTLPLYLYSDAVKPENTRGSRSMWEVWSQSVWCGGGMVL